MRLRIWLLIFLLFSVYSYGQINITFPMEKAVFQRNQNNQANLSIAGNYAINISIDLIKARLINPANENVVMDWTTIQSNPTGGVFNGTLVNVPGGWYRLELRSYLGGSINGTATLNRVGVGEVFLIAGQSNAQGLENIGNGAEDERVITHNELTWYDSGAGQCDKKFPNYPSLGQLNGPISKTGFSSWCYGRLGDLLTSRLNVPVAFFNAGATSTSSVNWKESSDNIPTPNHYNGSQLTFCNQVGVPYSGLKIILNYYASLFGVRAVLWHQGESDNFINLSGSTYQNNINYVINKSRADFGSTVPWVISKATLFHYDDTQADIRIAQQILGSDNANKIFPGPDTDLLGSGYRLDDVHFNSQGVIELANYWNSSLDDTFFNFATPIPAKSLPVVTVTQINSESQLLAPDGYSEYKWVRLDAGNTDYQDPEEATTRLISRVSGTYRCYLKDANGNITFTQPVTCGCLGAIACNGITYLSDMGACTAINGLGAIKYDKSNDGAPIKLKGVTYAKGIGCHANSEISYKLNGSFGRFITDIGLDDEVGPAPPVNGSAYFRVYADNALRYESPLLNNSSATIKLNIDVRGVQELKLITNYGPDNFNYDHTDWAGARLHCVDTQKPTQPQNLSESLVSQNCATISWSASTDNMEVEKYIIYLNDIKIDSVSASATSYRIKGLEPLFYYTARVSAKDYSGNESTLSNVAEIITLPDLMLGATPNTINIGQSTILQADCPGGTVLWSTGQTGISINVSPTTTTTYNATCTIGDCTSNTAFVSVKVIPDCQNAYTLTNPADNYELPSINLSFKASSTISASNAISNQAKVNYQAGQSVTLQPGFQVQAGSVFKIQIGGCSN
ncbi:NPCBM/NEW2 domain-containing protein [Emticicia sp. 17c]|uniref:NPCBM/NEW2 domain-containing protein n=1 Tax=Emticicia sp. 17c TaxID=3127704 RepID=UPI00301BCF8B